MKGPGPVVTGPPLRTVTLRGREWESLGPAPVWVLSLQGLRARERTEGLWVGGTRCRRCQSLSRSTQPGAWLPELRPRPLHPSVPVAVVPALVEAMEPK